MEPTKTNAAPHGSAAQTSCYSNQNSKPSDDATQATEAENFSTKPLSVDHTADSNPKLEAEQKRFATLQARAALAGGFVLRQLATGEYFVSGFGGMSRDFRNLDSVGFWLDFIEGRRK